MKKILALIMMTVTMNAMAQNGKATTIKKVFSRTTSVSIEIDATPSEVWKVLTNIDQYLEWNSTLTFIEGKAIKGEKIRLISTLDTNRTFKVKVKELKENELMVWGDPMADRNYIIKEQNGKVVFTVHEKMGGIMFPLFAKKIPPFDESFETFASDLKERAEQQ